MTQACTVLLAARFLCSILPRTAGQESRQETHPPAGGRSSVVPLGSRVAAGLRQMLLGDSSLGGHQVAFLLQHIGSLLNDTKRGTPIRVFREEHKAKLQPATQEAAPAVSLKLDLPREKALKSHR